MFRRRARSTYMSSARNPWLMILGALPVLGAAALAVDGLRAGFSLRTVVIVFLSAAAAGILFALAQAGIPARMKYRTAAEVALAVLLAVAFLKCLAWASLRGVLQLDRNAIVAAHLGVLCAALGRETGPVNVSSAHRHDYLPPVCLALMDGSFRSRVRPPILVHPACEF
jgi:hypothetical protein